MKNYNKKIIDWRSLNAHNNFIRILKQSGAVLAPSDTVLGLYTSVDRTGVERLNEIKNRCNKPYIILVKDWDTACSYGDRLQLESFKSIIDICWPGPLTVVVKTAKVAPDWMRDAMPTVALRIPVYDCLQELLQEMGAVFSTSANVAGQSVVQEIGQVDTTILEQVDAIFIDNVIASTTTASTIVDISSGSFSIIREGCYSREYLESLLK